MVMLYHLGPNLPPGRVTTFVLRGYLWVDLFFVLSGFVMAYNYQAAFVDGYRVQAHLAFLGRRIARIYPLYAVVTLGSAAVVLWKDPGVDLSHVALVLAANLTMIQGWGIAPSLAGAAWSISTEWAAYLLFPFLAAAALFSSRQAALMAACLSLAAIGILAAMPTEHLAFDFQGRRGPLDIYSSATLAPLVRCLAEFILGLLVFRAASGLLRRHRVAGTRSCALAVSAMLLLLVAMPGWDVAVVALFPVLLLCMVLQRDLFGRMFGAGVPYRLGEWSYAIYLIHDKFRVLEVRLAAGLANHLPFAEVIAMVLTSVLVVGCASALHAGIELPCRRLLRTGLRLRPMSEGPARKRRV